MHSVHTGARVAAPGEKLTMDKKTLSVTRREVIAAMGAVPVVLASRPVDASLAKSRGGRAPGLAGRS